METTVHPLTLDEYAALREPEDDHITELVRGRVLREPRPGSTHGDVQVTLAYHLKRWAIANDAKVYAESGFILSDDPATVRGPDVAVVQAPSPKEWQPGGWIRGAPDVAVEVLSPSNSPSETHDKVIQYLEAGAHRVWIVDPVARTVMIYRPDGSAVLLHGDDTIDGEDVLAGFSLALAEIFDT